MSDLLKRFANLSLEQRQLVLKEVRKQQGLALASEKGTGVSPIRPVSQRAGLPLSFAQQRLWFLDQFMPGNPAYNLPTALRLKGRLELATLERVLNEIIRRHETLRTTVLPLLTGDNSPPVPKPLSQATLAKRLKIRYAQ
jgi:hypothetical protein